MIRMNLGTPTTSLSEKGFEGNLHVFPNPGNGVFTIEFKDVKSGDYYIEITSILGKKVYSHYMKINGFLDEKIDLSTFGKGVYLLQISNSEKSINKKIIIE